MSAMPATINLSFREWATVCGDAKIITASLDHLTQRPHHGNPKGSYRSDASSTATARRKRDAIHALPHNDPKSKIKGE